MSVASAMATRMTSMQQDLQDQINQPGGLAGALPGGMMGMGNANLAMRLAQKAKARKAARQKRGLGGAAGAVGSVTGALAGGDNGRLDTIESRLTALEGGTEGDITQPSPTVNVPVSPEQGIGAAPALPKPTMATAEQMFSRGDLRQIAAGAGKFKK
tara:strand:- start:8057 stop:8527 length:471 start_codon:yes stop_codon:yes gene_type:complete